MDEEGAALTAERGALWDRPAAALASRGGVATAVVCACPYLVADDGWRAIAVSRDHRCAAIDPPGTVGAERQKRVCLVAAHVECATYRASEELRGIAPSLENDEAIPDRPIVQTIPVLLDGARSGARGALSLQRRGTQLGLVALMSVALAALIYARGIVPASERDPLASRPVATLPVVAVSASPSASGPVQTSPSPTASPVATPASPPAASPSVSAEPSPAEPSPTASASRSYVVKAGDTLVSIAARFGTTATTLRTLNHITDPRALRVGQVLALP